MTQPVVSVITIFLNGERFLAEAIESVLAQTSNAWELLLCDDGSSDASPDIAREYARRHPDRIRCLDHEGHRNRGMSATRNLGARHARAKYLCLLDGDDVYLPDKLSHQTAFMEANPDVAMVLGPTEYWHSWAGALEDARPDSVPALGLGGRDRFDPPELLSLVYPLGTAPAPCLCSLMIRADAYRRVGGFEETFRGFYEDQGFLAKMYARERVAALDVCLDRYRIHPDSCSAMVERAGTYAAHRTRYLRWLGKYLRSHEVTDPRISRLLADALGVQPADGVAVPASRSWINQLRVVDGNTAALETSADNPDLLRLAISQTSTPETHDIQLNLPRLVIEVSRRYTLSFLARSERPRMIAVGCADTRAPWMNLGLYREVSLTPDWQSFDFPFVASRAQPDARIHFDAGRVAVSVELSAVTLRDIDTGRFVWPSLPGGARGQAAAYVSPGDIDFGSLRRVTPLSDEFGLDRGGPVDRHYIDAFLEANRRFVKGAVLEVGDRTYTKRFGDDRVTSSDVLHVTPGDPEATIIADLTSADHIPSNAFDCFILTQTLQLIYDVPAALRTIHRILKPGGVVLATFPGISQTYDNNWGKTWYWNFTRVSARRLFDEAFGAEGVHLDVYGNVLSAASFLYGLGARELTAEELSFRGVGYDVTIGVRGVKQVPGTISHAGDERATESAAASGSAASLVSPRASARSVVLMYHRVTEGQVDPWSLCVSPRHFDEQLDVIRRFATPLSLLDLTAHLESRDLPDKSVVVTFDDGYLDNLTAALPTLRAYDTPATIFATSGYVGGGREFWWDELDALLLSPGTLPARLTLQVDGREYEWDLSSATRYGADDWHTVVPWRAADAPPSARHTTYLAIWRLLQLRPAPEQRAALDDLWRQAARTRTVRDSHRIVTIKELATLAADPLIEIGAHTVTHPSLADLSPEEQEREIVEGKAWLERELGRPVASLAYPFGAYTDETMILARRARYRVACSTVSDSVRNGADRFCIPRMHVHDWAGPEFARHLAVWLA